MTAVIPTAEEIVAAHAEADAAAVAAEAELADAESAAAEARAHLAELEAQLRDEGIDPGVDAFHAASVAVRRAELIAQGAQKRAADARGRVPDIAADLAIAAAKAYATGSHAAQIREAREALAAARKHFQELVSPHRARVLELARALADQGIAWSSPQAEGEYGWGTNTAVWHGLWYPPSELNGRPYGMVKRVDGFTVDGVTLMADEYMDADR